MKHHIHIKTYKKPSILEECLQSLDRYGYDRQQICITIGDDNPGECLDLLEKFPHVDAYLTGNINGIWANNNRGIKYFLEETDADALLILDHDIQFIEGGLLEEIEAASRVDCQEHLTGFAKGLDGVDGLQVVFPFVVESEFIKWHAGSHGVLQWQSRELVQKVGYQLEYSYFYGSEHAEYSHRCLKAQGYSPLGLYPVLKRSLKYFKLNPNDYRAYDMDIDKVMATNQEKMHERDKQTAQGLNLKESHHHLDKELVVRRKDRMSQEKIRNLLSIPAMA